MTSPFEPSLLNREPYRQLHPHFLAALATCDRWPAPEEYDALAACVPRADDARVPGFVTERREDVRRLGGYEHHVARLSLVPTRPRHWHDFFNMAVWAHFPKLRWALNALHVDPSIGPKDPRNGRAPAQNVAASFDEKGMVVVSTSASVLRDLRGLRFKRVFWERREEVLATTRFGVVGHGMLESLVRPHAGLAARSLLVRVTSLPGPAEEDEFRMWLDATVSMRVSAWRDQRCVLDPIPVLAIPGFSDNARESFYDAFENIPFVPSSRRPLIAEAPDDDSA